ncbi:hypothetical protein BLS_008188 [Venturia inaequalis]|uniref:Uncharacterized protein n=1 Tax=Venturia inaequalis TaxID=5025 RepID=A0A8H3U7N9_VENIN|nr:hypothetical protein BLS_008188 [Venturia inaequalis]KAE9973584.1 hypothetical protein EG328_004323 [Venturia inaequalis]KAE9991105.1 hypothetical protein EG327_000462 [Venturia inaequalis]
MAEALTAVAAASGLTDTAIRILRRLRKAHERKTKLPEVLDRHACELNSLKDIIELIDDEDSLQTATVAAELVRLRSVEDRLVKLLKELDSTSKGAVKQYAHQLSHGSTEEKRLAVIMEELCQVKSALLLRIQVASVGVMRGVGGLVLANADAIARVDSFLQERLGDGKGLKIARLIKGRRPSSEGNVSFTLRELASLDRDDKDEHSEDETLVDTDSDTSSTGSRKNKLSLTRIIIRNVTKEQAAMINAPIGKDLWTHISRLEIKDNRAEGDSMMINYAMTPEHFFKVMQLRMKS